MRRLHKIINRKTTLPAQTAFTMVEILISLGLIATLATITTIIISAFYFYIYKVLTFSAIA